MSAHARNGVVPWPLGRVTDDSLDETDVDRLMVFVPAIMSVGLIFSIATLLRDAFRWTGDRARERRTSIEAGAVVNDLLDSEVSDPGDIGILTRPTYLITAIVLAAGAAYVTIGSVANFVREGGYVRDIGWLLAISLGLAVILGFLGGVSFALFVTWPRPPAWTFGSLRTAPLSVTPGKAGEGPSWGVTASTFGAAGVLMILTIIVGSGRSVAMDIDQPIADWLVGIEWLDRLSAIDLFGKTIISVAFVALIGLSAFRCRVIAISYPVAFLVGWIGGEAIRETVDRPRPIQIGDFESFPSGHLVQAAFIAGLVPLAVNVLVSDRRAASAARVVLSLAVVATGLHRIHRQDHWPLDAFAGVALGLTVVLAVHWVVGHRAWHQRCGSCPWSDHPAPTPWRRGLFTIGPRAAKRLDALGAIWAIAAAAALLIATIWVGLPTDPEGSGFGSEISGPVQLTLAALLALFGIVALRSQAVGAVGIAFAATGLGLFASVQYRPLLTVMLSGLLLIPAILIWLSWHRTETVGRIAWLAAATVTLLTSTAFGSNEIYNYYFGPTHPGSAAEELESEADWLWLGEVEPSSATVVAGGLDRGEEAHLRYWQSGSTPRSARVVTTSADDFGLARFVLGELTPSTTYRYAVTESGEPALPDTPGDAGFTTPAEGPQDLVVVLGACARTGSNGAVFDAMLSEKPDLYLALGDMHYSNLSSTDPAAHVRAYGRALSQPGQAALFSSVPTAYVWDDHDYGPNDSGASSTSRLAVSTAYRRAVPHHGVDPDPQASIAQAFTVGRVRFVLTDTRSHRTASSMLGPEQLRWLIDELTTASRSHALVVWANPTPWIAPDHSGTDDWSAFPEERRVIADALAAAQVHNLIMVGGDAHMVAIDDGTNSGYATDGSPGFPLLHAGALDRPGSVKGGPYSHGAFPGGGQYGKLQIEDDGGPTIVVHLSGHTWDDSEVISLELAMDVPPTASVTGSILDS